MRLKKTLACVLALAALLGLMPALPALADPSGNLFSIVDESVANNELYPGRSSPVTFVVQNNTGKKLDKIWVSADATDSTNAVAQGTDPIMTSVPIGGTFGVTLDMSPRDGALTGPRYVPINLTCVSGDEEAFIATLSLLVNINPGESEDIMMDVQFSETSVEAGGKGTLKATVTNRGTAPATNVRLVMDGFSGGLVLTSNGSQTITRIGAGASHILYYEFAAESTASAGYYPITGMLYYKEYENGGTAVSFPFGITVSQQHIDMSTGMSIENVMMSKTTLNVNEAFTMQVALHNASRFSVRNVKIEVTVPEATIYNTTSNVVTVDRISGSSRHSSTFQFVIGDGTAPKYYNFEIKVTYEEQGNSGYVEKTLTRSTGVYVRPESDGGAAVLSDVVIESASMSRSSAKSGEDVVMTVVVKNNGNAPAYNLKTTFTPDEGLINRTQNIIMSGTLEPGKSLTLTCTVFAKPGVDAGNYSVAVTIGCQGKAGDESTAVQITQYSGFYVEGREGAGSANVVIESAVMSPQSVRPGANATVDVVVTNRGTESVYNLKTTFTPDEGLVNRSQNIVQSGKLEPGKSVTISCTVFSKLDVLASNYNVAISVSYQTVDGDAESAQTVSQYAGVYVQGKLSEDDKPGEDDENKTVPKIIVRSYTVTPQIVSAGTEFDLDFVFENTSSEKSVRNIKISFTAVESTESNNNVFTPVGASNTFYIDTIPTKGTAECSVRLYTVPDAKQKTYNLDLKFEYEDAEAEAYSESATIGIPVVQPAKLGTGDLNIMTDTMVGQPTYLSLDFYNAGKETMYNFMVSTEGDFDSTNKSYYVGQLEPGGTDFYDNNITPWMPGEVEGKVILSYEDAAGVQHVEELPFTLSVMDMMEPEPWPDPDNPDFPGDPDFPGEDGEGGFIGGIMKALGFWFYVIIGAVVVGAGLAVFFIIRRKRRRKASLVEDGDYIDDIDREFMQQGGGNPPYVNVITRQPADELPAGVASPTQPGQPSAQDGAQWSGEHEDPGSGQ